MVITWSIVVFFVQCCLLQKCTKTLCHLVVKLQMLIRLCNMLKWLTQDLSHQSHGYSSGLIYICYILNPWYLYLNKHMYDLVSKLPFLAFFTSAKEVMFFLVLVCLSVTNMTHKVINIFR